MQNSPTPPRPDEIDLRQVFAALSRAALPIAGATVLATAGTYVLSKRQAPTYEAVASVIAVDNARSNNIINNTLVTAPPLPQGAVEQAMQSKRVLGDVTLRLEKTDIDRAVLRKIRTDLSNELADNNFNRFTVKARLDPQQRGVYEIRASGESPEVARQLADAGLQALLAWDTDRAQDGVRRSRTSLQEQLRDLSERIRATPASSLERQSLIAARGQVLQNLSQVAVLETAATGTLTLVAEPVAPRRPVSPRPTRNSALAGLLALFLASGSALLLDALRRRVNGADDLLPMGLPLLGQMPMLRRKQMQTGIIEAARTGRLYESVGFLRINVQSMLQDSTTRRIVVSSAHPSEGKSSVTAALADSFASAGMRVLLIDADLRRPTQLKVWSPQAPEYVPLPGAIPGRQPATTVAGAYVNPEGAHATRVAPNVDLLPGGNGGRTGTAGILNQPNFRVLLDRWSEGYDIVLIDTPPMLSLPDTLAVAPYTDGVMLVVEAGQTRVADVERNLQNAQVANVRVLGLVLNKVSRGEGAGYYGYGYGYGYTYANRKGDNSPVRS